MYGNCNGCGELMELHWTPYGYFCGCEKGEVDKNAEVIHNDAGSECDSSDT